MQKLISKTGNLCTLALLVTGFVMINISPVFARAKIGESAPDFSAKTFAGDKIKLADYRGKVLVINIWATWCGPCKKELPLLDSFYAATEKNGLRVIAVTTEDSVPNEALKPLQAVLRLPLARYFHGPYVAIGDAVPSNYVIDRAGIVRYAKAGAFDLDALNAVLIPLLNEPAQNELGTEQKSFMPKH